MTLRRVEISLNVGFKSLDFSINLNFPIIKIYLNLSVSVNKKLTARQTETTRFHLILVFYCFPIKSPTLQVKNRDVEAAAGLNKSLTGSDEEEEERRRREKKRICFL